MHAMTCPWCSAEGWASGDVFQCRSARCAAQTASGEDVMAHAFGGFEQGMQMVSRALRKDLPLDYAMRRKAQRDVMDVWLSFCTSPSTSDAVALSNRLQGQGLGVAQSRFGAVVLGSKGIEELIRVAAATGGASPPQWDTTPPSAALAFCVQTVPHTIDRILLARDESRFDEIVWRRYSAGVSCLMGLTPETPRMLTAEVMTMLRLQSVLKNHGRSEEAAALFIDYSGRDAEHSWRPDSHMLTAIVRSPEPDSSNLIYGPLDIVRIQEAADRLPGLAGCMKAMPVESVLGVRPDNRHFSWDSMRCATIASLVSPADIRLPQDAAMLFERTGARRYDAVEMSTAFRDAGRLELSEDVKRLSKTRVIFTDGRVLVRETASEYQILQNSGYASIANFSLDIRTNVMFHSHGTAYCQAWLRCDDSEVDVLFSQTLLSSKIGNLQDELQRQVARAVGKNKASRMPTVIHTDYFRKYVIRYLRRQMADAVTVPGIDRLGWHADRKTFCCAGFIVDSDGVRSARSGMLCPTVRTLRLFEQTDEWSQTFPKDLDPSCRDIIAMLLASCVRYFKRCSTQPVKVAQSSDALALLESIVAGVGQKEILEINSNVREGNLVEGCHGYPILAAGAAGAVQQGQAPFVHLTDVGYVLRTSPDGAAVEAAARALQYSLLRVVEWCLATGADGFREMPSVRYNDALLREGNWLLEHVCKSTDAEPQAMTQTAMEKLLSQIPPADTFARTLLTDGMDLTLDIRGLEIDHDGLLREAKEMGAVVAIEDGEIHAPAAVFLPMMATFYGHNPETRLADSLSASQ